MLHKANDTFLLPELFPVEMVLSILGACEVKLMFIKICDTLSREVCSKVYETLLFYGNREMGGDS